MLSTIVQSIKSLSTGQTYTFTNYIPCELAISRNDVSMATAGRDEAGYMHKEMLGTSVKGTITFKNVPTSVVHDVCQIVESGEYVSVRMLDPVDGVAPNYLVTRTYYVGDRNLSLYNATLDVWSSLSFSVIERGVH